MKADVLEQFRFGSMVFVTLLGMRSQGRGQREGGSAALMIISKSFFAQNNFLRKLSIPPFLDMFWQMLWCSLPNGIRGAETLIELNHPSTVSTRTDRLRQLLAAL